MTNWLLDTNVVSELLSVIASEAKIPWGWIAAGSVAD